MSDMSIVDLPSRETETTVPVPGEQKKEVQPDTGTLESVTKIFKKLYKHVLVLAAASGLGYAAYQARDEVKNTLSDVNEAVLGKREEPLSHEMAKLRDLRITQDAKGFYALYYKVQFEQKTKEFADRNIGEALFTTSELSRLAFRSGDLKTAWEQAQKGRGLLTNETDESYVVNINHVLASVLTEQQNHKDAEDFYKKAVGAMSDPPDPAMIAEYVLCCLKNKSPLPLGVTREAFEKSLKESRVLIAAFEKREDAGMFGTPNPEKHKQREYIELLRWYRIEAKFVEVLTLLPEVGPIQRKR